MSPTSPRLAFLNWIKNKRPRSNTDNLRRDAERRVAKKPAGTNPPTSEADIQKLIHELEVSRVELELQNEKLRRTKTEVNDSYKEFEDLYQNSPCGYHSLDASGAFALINDTELRWLGYSRDEVMGKMKLTDLLPAAGRPNFRAIFRKMIETGVARDVYMELTRKDGSLLPVLANTSVVRDARGRFVCTRSTVTDMTVPRRLKRQVAAHARRIRELSHRLVALHEEERREIAEELHARTSMNFAALKINLEMIRADLPEISSPDVRSRIEDGIALLEDTVAGIRDICADLRPPLLDYAGLVAALDEFAQRLAKRTGIAIQFAASESKLRLDPGVESGLFRIAQESITNCIKHSGAKQVDIELTQVADHCVLTIVDDGIGFDPKRLRGSGRAPGLGLLNMRERAEFIGGTFSLESQPGHGTRVKVVI